MFLSPRYSHDILDPPAIFHVAMENSLLIDNVPIKTFTYKGFSIATCDYLRVTLTHIALCMEYLPTFPPKMAQM